MDQRDIRTLKILEEIDQEHTPSQRALANDLNVSLGLVNSFIKRLANKGYFKIVNIQRNRVKYLLTPKGVAEKTRLTYEFIKLSYQFYNGARQKLREIYKKLEDEGCYRLVFYGAGDLAEIAYVSTQGTLIKVTAIIDNQKIGKSFFDYKILGLEELKSILFDKILITQLNASDEIFKTLPEIEDFRNKLVMLDSITQ